MASPAMAAAATATCPPLATNAVVPRVTVAAPKAGKAIVAELTAMAVARTTPPKAIFEHIFKVRASSNHKKKEDVD